MMSSLAGAGWSLRKSAAAVQRSAVGEFEFRVRGVSGLRCVSLDAGGLLVWSDPLLLHWWG